MNLLDMRTVILSSTISTLICLVVMAALWRWNRERFSGIGFWLAAFLLQFLPLPLFVLRGVIPDFLSITLSNTIAMGGTLLLYIGLEYFTGHRGPQIHNYILLVIFLIVYSYFVDISPNLAVRNLIFSAGLLTIYAQSAWLMLRRVAPRLRSSTRNVGYVSLAFCLVSLGRIVITLFVPPGDDFFHSNDYETMLLIIYQMLFIILTFSLFLLVNNRLFSTLKDADERYKNFFSHSFEAIYRTEFDHPIDTSLPVETQIDQIYQNAYMAEYNQAMAEMYNLSSKETMLGMRLMDAHGGSDNPTNRAAFRRVIEGGYKSTNDETIEQDAQGNLIWLLNNTIGIVENGFLVRLWGTSINITKRKRAEEALISEQEFINKALDTQVETFFLFDVFSGKALRWNRAFREISGYSDEEIAALQAPVSYYSAEDLVSVNDAIRRILQGESVTVTMDLICKDGHKVPTEYQAAALKDEKGDYRFILAIGRNITDRRRAEAALMQAKQQAEDSEMRFRQSLDFSPVPIAVADSNGNLSFMNKQFVVAYGYTLQDIQTLSQWFVLAYPDSEYRAAVLKQWEMDTEVAVKNSAPTQVREYQVVCKSGEIKTVEISAYFEDDLAIGLFLDISERKQAEGIHQLRLRLWEFSASHAAEEIMQMALDEIEKITGSPIGFYHFMEEDQNTLSRKKAWSTRTKAEFCMVEGPSMHYSISEAGVWADCFHQKRPVIHNDYASLPNRKGTPNGHTAILRELVVPIIREGRVVSILGVGNKPFDYNERDVELVSYVADVVWTIVEYKQAEEHIHRLNSQLERLAMTDELTGLANRRSFFLKGEAEIHRVLRYAIPLSLITLDIDRFKSVNDTFGHAAGDLVLKRIAAVLQTNIRDVDVLARLGGEEFGILLLNTQAENAVELAERLRLAVEQEIYTFHDQKISATISIGVAEYRTNMLNLDSLLRKADTAMYQAKNQGRNQVVCLD